MRKKQVSVVTWNDSIAILPKGKTILQHIIGPYYAAQIGYLSLLNLNYCICFVRPKGYKGDGGYVGGRIAYNLLKKAHAVGAIKTKVVSMKRGIVSVLPRKMSLRIVLRQIPRESATNLPPHRHDYQFLAVCLKGRNGEIVDIDCRCRDAQELRTR